jgi:hypothetical protein
VVVVKKIAICLLPLVLAAGVVLADDLLHKPTLTYRRSVDVAEWLAVNSVAAGDVVVRPDMSAVLNPDGTPKVPPRYWKLNATSDGVVGMDAAEQAAKDAQLITGRRTEHFAKPERPPALFTRGVSGSEELVVRWGDGTEKVVVTQR